MVFLGSSRWNFWQVKEKKINFVLFCMENSKFALRVIWKNFFTCFYIENKEIFLTTLYGKPKTHKKVSFKALLRLSLTIPIIHFVLLKYHIFSRLC